MQHENLTTQLEFLSPSCRFKFPSVFIIYQTITVTVYAILILIGYTAKEALFCSSDDVRESLEKPTPFCILIGRTLHYHIHVSVRLVLSNQALFSFWLSIEDLRTTNSINIKFHTSMCGSGGN